MREAIVVLGMHRSGTSMVSGILKHAGLDLGKNMWKPDHANEKGYFENSRIGEFNDRLLGMLHATWYDTFQLPDPWWLDEAVSTHFGRFREILTEEFDESSFLLFKDPRISILLPFYLITFKKLDIRGRFIINFRDPWEVAASLKKRDNLPVSRGLLLWMDYTLKAELFTRGHPRIFLHYEKVLNEPLQYLEMIFRHFDLDFASSPSQAERIEKFAEKSLNHHTGIKGIDALNGPAGMGRLYEHLCSLDGKDVSKAGLKAFDQIMAGFYEEIMLYSGVDQHFEASLQVETAGMKRRAYRAQIRHGDNHLTFPIDCEDPVSRIILRPCNQKTALILHRTYITGTTNEVTEIRPSYTNAGWSDPDGSLVFESEVPEINYYLGSPQALSTVSVEFTTLVIAHPTDRLGRTKRDHCIKDLSETKMSLQYQQAKNGQEIDELNLRIKAGIAETSELRAAIDRKEQEYLEAASGFRREMETMSALFAKNEEVYQGMIASRESEITSLSATMARLETVYQESLGTRQQEIERLKRELEDSLAQRARERESGEDEKARLSEEIRRITDEKAHALELKHREISALEEQFRARQAEWSQALDSLVNEMKEAREAHDKQMAHITSLLTGKEQEISIYRSVLAEKEHELSVILNSYTWKAGKFIVAPARLFTGKNKTG